jgi:phenylalanyl-tRNA synthetase beta chain
MEVEDNIKLLNATNPNIETLRKSIIPTQFVQVNSNTGYAPEFGIFEIGHVVDGVDENNMCVEYKKLAITLFSKEHTLEETYLYLRDIVAVLVSDVRHKNITFQKLEAPHSYQHPKNLNAILVDGEAIGEIGIAHPAVSKKIDKKAAIAYVEIDVDKLAAVENAGISYEEPSKYPGIEVDLSFIADRFEQIGTAIKSAKSELLKKVSVTDVYSDENGKSITVRLVFSHNDRTLTREEVTEVTDRIIEQLKSEGINLKL